VWVGWSQAAARALLGLAVADRLSMVGGRAGGVRVAGGLRGDQLLMDLLKLAMDGSLAFQVLTVQALDELMSWLPAHKLFFVVESARLACGGSPPTISFA